MYEVFLERTARDDIKHLPKDTSHRIVARIRSLADDPRPTGCRKLEGSVNDWRLRVGPYRIIYEIEDSSRRVNVMRVKHRRDAYRR